MFRLCFVLLEGCLCSELVFWFRAGVCVTILYYIIYYILYIILYIIYYTIIYSPSVLFSSSFPILSSLPFYSLPIYLLFPSPFLSSFIPSSILSPPIYSSSPFPSSIPFTILCSSFSFFPSSSFYTCRYLHNLIYIHLIQQIIPEF